MTDASMSTSFAPGDFRVGGVLKRTASVLSRHFLVFMVVSVVANLPLILLWSRADSLRHALRGATPMVTTSSYFPSAPWGFSCSTTFSAKPSSCTRHFGRCARGRSVLVVVLYTVGNFVSGVIGLAIAPFGNVVLTVLDLTSNSLWSAYYAIAVVVAYNDLRVTKEGIDIEQITAVFD